MKCSNWERESIFCRINGSSALFITPRTTALTVPVTHNAFKCETTVTTAIFHESQNFKDVPSTDTIADFHFHTTTKFTPSALFLFFLSTSLVYEWMCFSPNNASQTATETSVSAIATVLLRAFCGDHLLWQKMLNQPLHLSSFPAGDRANKDLETTRRKWVMIVSS